MNESRPSPASAAPPAAPSPQPALGAGPIQEGQRIASIDALRGFALMGILVVNIQAFAMVQTALVNPAGFGHFEGVDYAIWLATDVFFAQKFLVVFSMLFGAGIMLTASRWEARGQSSAGLHYRRMGVLSLIGLLHAHLIWYGDILFAYALCGMLVYLMRKFPPWLLVVLGLLALALPSGLLEVGYRVVPRPEPFWLEMSDMIKETWMPPPEQIADEIAAYRGGWWEQMSRRPWTALEYETANFFVFISWIVGGLMLIGMAFYKMGVFSAARSARFYAGLIAMAVLIGLPMNLLGVHRVNQAEWEPIYTMFRGVQYHYWGTILVGLGWMGAAMLVFKWGALPSLTNRLAAVGRMALTNYLMQSVICTTIFYGHGFGLFEKVDRLGQLVVVIGVCIVQLLISPWWMKRFRFGPVEWLWRSLTYMNRQPMRRAT